ncbi:redoxin domain-containing protein [Parvularcula flava]|uniref:Redoxin domain-containing protein n=1 Tax=Aquisalinus luteolus TaxID=1566827 RepID=A0A8J3A9Q7_9PROT|nr:2OG-Fe(II) oxygenase [Aquisalinus luteolus]NHK29509.1 redoxin domain-containing protein [Aquisalinus luteolus]GGI01723.1 hypothetical protein GCM10011355_33050 [Aquisalinus luteolus]
MTKDIKQDTARYVRLDAGDPAPWFYQRTFANDRFAFHTAGGRYIVLSFFSSAADEHSRSAIKAVMDRKDLFDETKAIFFGVSTDPDDEGQKRIAEFYPGYRFVLDYDGSVSRSYGVLPAQETTGTNITNLPARRRWFVLDPTLRIMNVIPFRQDRSDISDLVTYLDGLPPAAEFAGTPLQAPVIVLPNVFDRAFCNELIGLYEKNGGTESGFMRERDGKTVTMHDHSHKRRRDYLIQENEIIRHSQSLFRRRVVPEIAKIHQFNVQRMERYIVSCYSAEEQGHFRPHRDNTTKGTAHRRFAVSVNLNDDFEGGEVVFPEYGQRGFKMPAGGAVVFSCSLLHCVRPVTRGKRYAFLPFLYDDAAAKIREQNNSFLGEGVGKYQGR